MIPAGNRNIRPPVCHRLIKTPGSRFFSTQGLLINPSHMLVAKSPVKGDRRLDITDIDTNVGHAHDLSLLITGFQRRDSALLELEINPVGITHEDEAIPGRTVGFTEKFDALRFK